MTNLISEGSIITWGHVNLHGEFNFNRQGTNDNLFNMGKRLSLKLTEP